MNASLSSPSAKKLTLKFYALKSHLLFAQDSALKEDLNHSKKPLSFQRKNPKSMRSCFTKKKAASLSQKKTFIQEKLEELARKTSLISVFKKKFEKPIAFISDRLTIDLFTTYPKSILNEIEEVFGEKFSKKDLPLPSFGFHVSLNQERIEEEKPSFNFQHTSKSTIFLQEMIEL